jgi:hypothetical protein
LLVPALEVVKVLLYLVIVVCVPLRFSERVAEELFGLCFRGIIPSLLLVEAAWVVSRSEVYVVGRLIFDTVGGARRSVAHG